ncbi:Uncharacterised protein [Candidatus Tiddalikarchaeum anstoanum]|nr:Uncharacterised protein [Candidatus Tiddalikarchaeum anstoanum]
MIESFKNLGNNFYFVDTNTIKDNKIINELSTLTYNFSEITYADYKQNIKPTWSLEKCRDKITKQYHRLYMHVSEELIDFLLGSTTFNLIPEVEKYFSKIGFFCYNKFLFENKEMRNNIYVGIMNLLKSETEPKRHYFGEIPVESEKMRYFSMKYGGFIPCYDLKIVNSLIKNFKIDARSEPKLVESELKGFSFKEAPYETYYKPHSIFLLTKFANA